MKKLKKKIFWVIASILTVFLVSVLCIFNYQDYKHEKTEIENKLSRMEENREKPTNPGDSTKIEPPENVQDKENNEIKEQPTSEPPVMPVFMDAKVYTVKYDANYEITEIINYTQNNISEDEIRKIAKGILETEKTDITNNQDKKDRIKIGNLYKNQYSYSFQEPNTLTLIDNTSSKIKLISLLKTSILIFVLVEFAIIALSIKITQWIIKPVKESFAKQKQFVADASHELKTPIAVIVANAEALEKEPQEAKWLNNIKSEAERMNELVTNLLDLAKLEEGQGKENFQEEDLSKIVEMSVLTFESLLYENKIELKYDIQKNIKTRCNSGQIKQLVAILLDNAIKHSNERGKITITLKKQKNEIVLTVSNKGKEIPKEIQGKIFERFYKADESRNRDDNRYGLGLAIAKNIVENQNGKITVESEKEMTTFKVVLK